MLVLAGCEPRGQLAVQWSFERQAGVVVGNCLAIRSASLAPGSAVQVVNTVPPQSVAAARTEGPDPSCAAAEIHGYRVTPPAGPVPAIGITGYRGPFRTEGGRVSADLDGDGQPEYFRSCTSSEGVHFTIWSGTPLTGRLRWHEYHPLGYDVDPDCKPEEVVAVK